MKHFLIITNSLKDTGLRLTEEIQQYVQKCGGSCQVFVSSGRDLEQAAPREEMIRPEMECVLVLGGDGTLIRAAAALVHTRLPLIGVNMGTLGYLCELEEKDVFAAVDRLMADEYSVEERMMLAGNGRKDGRETEAGAALNDVVIHRTGALSVVSLIVYVNGEYLTTYDADGIILSTPTGSTGYNMSAGGPIVDPKAQMILITPINAHNLSSRSIVVSADNEVTVEIGERRFQRDETVEVSFDGDSKVRLHVGDRLIVRRAGDTARVCKLSRDSFLEILRKKMSAYN